MDKPVDSTQLNQDSRPLFDALKQHQKRETVSFHVPGHKNGLNWPEEDKLKQSLFLDQTEVAGLDYLHEAETVLKESQELLADYVSSRSSHYLVNGSTIGNLAMILGTISKAEKVIVMRNAHQSILHGLELSEAEPLFLTPAWNDEKEDRMNVSLADLKKVFSEYSDVKAVIFTYPTYDGHIFPISELIDYCHSKGAVVLVDEAHGAHFSLGKPFPLSSLALGADVVVQSAHKMLPAMTQSGYLHVNRRTSKKIENEVLYYLHILQSSSPSYILMHSLEYARHFLAHYTSVDLNETLTYRDRWIKSFEAAGLRYKQSDDPLKGRIAWEGKTGQELTEILEKQGVFSERTAEENVLLTFPLIKAGTKTSVLSINLPRSSDLQTPEKIHEIPAYPLQTRLAMSYTKQKKTAKTSIAFQEATGMIAAQNITPYPPGIPLIFKGEKMTAQTICQISSIAKKQQRIVGLEKGSTILVYKRD
ncbi:MAG: aminotransferase class V-fold PLP-dependent enzyme [Pisciglobus halotolerans]|nr:aminotransferase class V-fold PLP-dependent enzyme [Pisciglobus halotolerans]